MSSTKTIRTTLVYEDATTRTYSLPASQNITAALAKSRVAAFNAAAATGTSDVNKTFISDTGQTVTQISEAEIVTKTEEVIYNG